MMSLWDALRMNMMISYQELVRTFLSTPDYIWGRMMAASLVTALPVVIMYALSERFIKSGLTAGGVKG